MALTHRPRTGIELPGKLQIRWSVAKNALLWLPWIHLCGQLDLQSKETPHLASDLVVEVEGGAVDESISKAFSSLTVGALTVGALTVAQSPDAHQCVGKPVQSDSCTSSCQRQVAQHS